MAGVTWQSAYDQAAITPDNPSRYNTSITSHEYLLERLREIKLI